MSPALTLSYIPHITRVSYLAQVSSCRNESWSFHTKIAFHSLRKQSLYLDALQSPAWLRLRALNCLNMAWRDLYILIPASLPTSPVGSPSLIPSHSVSKTGNFLDHPMCLFSQDLCLHSCHILQRKDPSSLPTGQASLLIPHHSPIPPFSTL